jgi:hypothetical protein
MYANTFEPYLKKHEYLKISQQHGRWVAMLKISGVTVRIASGATIQEAMDCLLSIITKERLTYDNPTAT